MTNPLAPSSTVTTRPVVRAESLIGDQSTGAICAGTSNSAKISSVDRQALDHFGREPCLIAVGHDRHVSSSRAARPTGTRSAASRHRSRNGPSARRYDLTPAASSAAGRAVCARHRRRASRRRGSRRRRARGSWKSDAATTRRCGMPRKCFSRLWLWVGPYPRAPPDRRAHHRPGRWRARCTWPGTWRCGSRPDRRPA